MGMALAGSPFLRVALASQLYASALVLSRATTPSSSVIASANLPALIAFTPCPYWGSSGLTGALVRAPSPPPPPPPPAAVARFGTASANISKTSTAAMIVLMVGSSFAKKLAGGSKRSRCEAARAAAPRGVVLTQPSPRGCVPQLEPPRTLSGCRRPRRTPADGPFSAACTLELRHARAGTILILLGGSPAHSTRTLHHAVADDGHRPLARDHVPSLGRGDALDDRAPRPLGQLTAGTREGHRGDRLALGAIGARPDGGIHPIECHEASAAIADRHADLDLDLSGLVHRRLHDLIGFRERERHVPSPLLVVDRASPVYSAVVPPSITSSLPVT